MLCLPKICGPFSVKKLEIKLDVWDEVHHTLGQEVTGYLMIELDGKMEMSRLSVCLVGDVKVEWQSGRAQIYDKYRFFEMKNIFKSGKYHLVEISCHIHVIFPRFNETCNWILQNSI